MTTRLHKILIGALVVQLALVAIVRLRGGDDVAKKPEPLLAGFDAAKVTALRVFASDGAKPAVELAKRGDGWVVTSAFDYPAADAKVGDLLASIAKLAVTDPIATQASRHKQLRVDDAAFERKLVIAIGGKDTTLFVGSAAGSRRTAVRIGDDPRVFAVGGLSAWTIGAAPRDWVEPSYVKVARDELASVTIEHDGKKLAFERDGDAWKVAIDGAPLQLAAGETLDTAAIDRVVGDASTIDLASPADPKHDASRPAATITLVKKPSGTSSAAPVVVDVIALDGTYWVHDRAVPRAVTVDKNRLVDVVEVARDKLVKKADAKAETPAPHAG